MKITTRKVAGGFIGMVVPDEDEPIGNRMTHKLDPHKWKCRTALGIYPTEKEAYGAAALLKCLNPASFGLEGDSARVCQPSDIDAVRGKKGRTK